MYNVGLIAELTRHARSCMSLSLRKFPLRVLLWLPLPVVVAWAVNRERLDYADARTQVRAEAHEAGLSVGNVVALRVMRQFQELEFLASAIRGAPDALDSRSRALLRASVERNPELFALNVQSADGRRIAWSSAPGVAHPIFKPQHFTPLPRRPQFLLGPIGYAPRFHADVLALRYRQVDAAGRVLYYIGSPYRAADLAPTPRLGAGWSVALRDLRDGRLFGESRAGARSPGAAQLASRVPIDGLPLSVEVGAPPHAVWALYARGLGLRLAGRALVVLLTMLGALAIGRLLQTRERLLRRNTARARYNALLARVNQAMLGAHDVAELAAAVCRLAVREAPIRLAWIGRADPAGDVELLAHAGASGAPPVDTALAAAQARIAHAWRDAQPAFAAYGGGTTEDGCAVLPLQQDGVVRALLGVHWSPQRRIGPDLQRALLDLARDVANGLARVELQRRLERMTLVDPLTDLPNRRALERHLEHAIRRAERLGAVVAVGLVDLDDFKPVNDRYGHEIGDALLRQLGERLRALMRGSEMVARLGGDEFVLVIEDLDAHHAVSQLGPVLERLHGAVHAAFDLGDGRSASVGLSMGLVLAPGDGREPDALLRLADATMYRVKHQKATRQSWWQLAGGGGDDEPAEPPFDPFGSDARQLLGGVREVLDAVDALFIDTLYAELAQRAQTQAIVDVLAPVRRDRLKHAQRAHLRFLLDPATSAAQIRQRAAGLGRLHALVGVTPSALVAAMQLFRELLGWHLDSGGRHSRERYRLLRVVDARVQMDLQDQLDAMVEVHSAYNAYAARPLPRPGQAWAEAVDTELGALAALPGIQGCVLQRPDAAGVLAAQASAGPQAAAIAAALSTPGLQSSLDPHSANGRGLSAQAWRTEAIASAPEYQGHAGLGPWLEIAARLGIRSAAAMQLLHGGQTDAVLALYGAFPNQFDTEQGRNFVAAVRNRWNMIDEQIHRRQPLLRQQDAEAYRQLLYADGLRMYVQPVVQLDDGRLRKVEALARLIEADGRVIAPGQFLPALRDADLDALFRMGLAQALQAQRAWREQGVDVDVSLNLPPSTLLHADCAGWVDEALRQHRVAAPRLTLELLESQEIDATRRDAAIAALKALGVQLAIDDRGSGFSSLKRLASLPFDVIKVDQALVLDIERDPVKALSLIRTIIQIGRDFEKEVIVEGVENDAVIEAVSLLGANCGQGYGIARPMPADAFVAWARSGAVRLQTAPPLRTALGALAFHWLHMHDEPVHRVAHADACPLAEFLQRRDDAAQAIDWHRTVHDATDPGARKAASSQLVAWLAEAAAR